MHCWQSVAAGPFWPCFAYPTSPWKAPWDKFHIPIYLFQPNWPVWCMFWGTFFKSSKSWGIFQKNRFLGSVFGVFSCSAAISEPICMKFWLPGKNWFFTPPYFIKKFISTNRSRVKDPHFLAKKQQKMAFFEKTEYWGLKDPLEVRVQHGTCIYMGDTFSRHFEPKKFNRVGRRGQKQPKLGIFEGTNIGSQNFMHIGSEMATLQEKNPKMDPKKRFFWKIPQDF